MNLSNHIRTEARWVMDLGCLVSVILAMATAQVHGAVRYVDVASAAPAPPYTSWASAAATIQDAIDAAAEGDEIVVTNGVYQTGGQLVSGIETNRVAVTKPLTVRSVNGPEVTVIDGGGALRCVYLDERATLMGFTLTNGFGRNGGGLRCVSTNSLIANCVLSGNSALYSGGGASGGTLNNCTLTGNRTDGSGGGASGATLNNCTLTRNSSFGDREDGNGGGAYSCTLNHCTLTDNSAYNGGGAYNCAVNHCTLAVNSASYGGGAYRGTMNNCTVTGNAAGRGGGAANATLNNCILTGNATSPSGSGGGAFQSILNNCTLTGNSAYDGGGVIYGTLNNCTLTGNSAISGGGARFGTLNNCIVYFNTIANGDSSNYLGSILNFSCTTPLPTNGVGNITDEPQLASASHLSADSPCRGAGSAAHASGVDIDGEAWADPPSMGCDEFHSLGASGPLSAAIVASYTNVVAGFEVNFTAQIIGHASDSRWEFGDGTVVSNRPYSSHRWAMAGDYPVILRVYNETYPLGVSATLTVHVIEPPVHYVSLISSTPVAPYSSWSTAATNIQDAIDAASLPGAVVMVNDGVYETGGGAINGTVTNRVEVAKPLTVRSVNGPEMTVINGGGVVRCVYLGERSTLAGFTLINGATTNSDGGGVKCASASAVVSNCVLRGNLAYYAGGGVSGGTLYNCTLIGNTANFLYGGGASRAALHNCALIGNKAGNSGGGAYSGTLNNCTLTGNVAGEGGGAFNSTLNNCIVYYNTVSFGVGPNHYGGSLNYSCTTPLPATGVGNIIDEPQLTSASTLSAGSPCRGAGSANATSGVDIDGEAWASPPSIGCDEYHEGNMTGLLTVAIDASYTNIANGFAVDFQGRIGGRVRASRWEFGDGSMVNNQPYTSHRWAIPGDYPVVLWAYNESYPEGVSVTSTVHVVEAPVHYVSLTSSTPVSPYSSWATAATNIQDGIDAAVVGGLVLVSNGVYQSGARVVEGAVSNRVAVAKPLTVRSVNGSEVTVIRGGNGIRCVYLTKGTALAGFTLTNGVSFAGAGVWCESARCVVSNCTLTGNSASGWGGGAYSGTLNNCTLTNNFSVDLGGGAVGSTLNNCALTGNRVHGGCHDDCRGSGGGAFDCIMNNCTLSRNSAGGYGGGADQCTLTSCTLTGNTAGYGGGASSCTLNNCGLVGNSSVGYGGGAHWGTLNNCMLTGNTANAYGGGAYLATLNNCSLTGNLAEWDGGGAYNAVLNNCIIYYNRINGTSITSGTGTNYAYGTLNYSCTFPLPPSGQGNFTNTPIFVNQAGGDLRLHLKSPCINAGRNTYTPAGPDLDGLPRIAGGTVDVGAYEFQSPTSRISYAWLQQYGLPRDGSADDSDHDGDQFNNGQEWRAGTDPTDPLSALRLRLPLLIGSDLAVTWESVADRSYFLEGSKNLASPALFERVGMSIPGQAGTTTYTHTNAAGAGFYFYRVGVEE